mmetsp:Transcript_31604/g.39327  ORF Transcript_31604/g.39327 Transcript_31604/m.39327 type:complete len:239 (-) Transcript_31604:412-1128(-)
MHIPAHGGKRYSEEEHHFTFPHDEHSFDGHTDSHIATYHPTHHELDHAYDDQHDVEPVHFHEHAVLKAFDHPESHSYHESDFYHHDGKYADLGYTHHGEQYGEHLHPHFDSHLALAQIVPQDTHNHQEEAHILPEHYKIEVERTPFEHQRRYEVIEDHHVDLAHDQYIHKPMHFIIEEPTREEHHETFHGREAGYMYREHGDEHKDTHFGAHTEEPWQGSRHGETYGAHHGEDHYELT